MTDTTQNPYRTKAQARKASLIASVLTAHGATAAEVALLPDEARRTVEALAGVNRSSDETWALVEGILEAQETRRPRPPVNVEALVA
jgi:hypothetical protein